MNNSRLKYIRVALYTCLSFIILVGCTKEIRIDYKNIKPKYVIQADIDPEGGEVKINTTIDMTNGGETPAVNNAEVELVNEEGERVKYYRTAGSSYKALGLQDDFLEVGKNYTLSVKVDDREYASTSMVHEELKIGEVVFDFQKISGKVGFLSLRVEYFDTPAEHDYYMYTAYIEQSEENKEDAPQEDGSEPKIMTGIFTDRGFTGVYQEFTISLGMVGVGSTAKIKEGDTLHVQVNEVDKQEYDFWASLGKQGQNAMSTFSNGAIGYFNLFKKRTVIKAVYTNENTQ